MVVRIGLTVFVYTDSQSLIQGFDNIKHPNNSSRRQYLKKQNYVMWSCIENIFKSHNLSITLHKVPAHAEDIYNNMADTLAKQGATSDIKGCPDLINLSPIKFIPKFFSLPIETNIKKFINDVFQAKQFQTLLSLNRFRILNQLNVDQNISWKATWHVYAVLILGRDMSLDGTAWDSPRTWTEGVKSLDIWDIYIIYIYTGFFSKLIVKLKSNYMIILPSNGPILMNIFLFCISY